MAFNSSIKQGTDKMALKELEENNILREKDMLQNLYKIWNEICIDEEQQVSRATDVWGYVSDLWHQIVNKETEFYETVKNRVKFYEEQISELVEQLGLPKGEGVSGTLIEREEILRKQLDEISRLKKMRLKDFQELRSKELKYCKMLGMPTLSLSSTTGVPTEKDICDLQHHVNMLKDEKERRRERFCVLKKELTTIMEVTELITETPLEIEILTSEEDSMSLSSKALNQLEEIVTKTKCKRVELENERTQLMEKLTMLWDVLKIENDERDKFLSKYTCCRLSSLNAIREEIARCETIKRQNIRKYVEALRGELASLLEQCFIHNNQFLSNPFEVDELNETVLKSHEEEISKWIKYYKETEDIIRKIKKRQELWDLMIVFENKANDPNRFKNRGGNLLQEERKRKKLHKDLPALENEIFNDIHLYEGTIPGKQFLYYGEKFQDFVTKQWDDRTAQKENEKKVRQLLRMQQLEGRTPAKRTFCTTPQSAPSKLFKSSAGLSVSRTPKSSNAKQIPSTAIKAKSNKSALHAIPKRNILKGKNINRQENSNNTTTYTDFEDVLNSSSKYAFRSSVLTSKKIVGTRISKRNSNSVSKRKSLQKKASTSKITPSRGKFGLPFLI